MPTLIATEVSNLVELARNKTVEGRNTLVTAIGTLIDANEREFSAQELALMNDILKKLIQDVAKPIRRILAEKLAKASSAPTEVVELLANEEIDIASPILLQSALLSDHVLIEIVRKRTRSHRLAIAMRRQVSSAVCDALVESQETDVIKALLNNHGAQISKATLVYLVEQSKSVDEYQEPLLRRQELGPELAQKMYSWVSSALQHYIVANYQVDHHDLEVKLAEATMEALEAEVGEANPDPAQSLASLLAQSQGLRQDMVVQTLRRGEVPLFEAMMSQLIGLPQPLTCRLLYEEDADGFAIACRAAAFDRSTFTTLFLLLQRVASHGRSDDSQKLRRGLELFDRLRTETSRRVISRFVDDPDFLRNLKQQGRGHK